MTGTLLHEQIAHELHDLAEMVRCNPELAESFRYVFDRILLNLWDADSKATMASLARAGKAADAKVEKNFDKDDWAELVLCFGEHVSLVVYADRELVCEKVVTGTREVTRKVPDPAAPLVEITEIVEDIEWKCSPLLEEATS